MRHLHVIFFLAFAIIAGSVLKAQAQKGNAAAFSNTPVTMTDAVKIGYGCGWDYPCPPRPYYGKRHYQFKYANRNGQVNIHNNYGTVNVYLNGRRHIYHKHHYHRPSYNHKPYYHGCRTYDCGRAYWKRVERRDTFVRVYPERSITNCGGYPCDANCGTWCWYRRFKSGYCGHGCGAYREKVRFETDERTIRVPRPVFVDPVRRDDVVDRRYDDDARYEVPAEDETLPRRRYYGPPYPP